MEEQWTPKVGEIVYSYPRWMSRDDMSEKLEVTKVTAKQFKAKHATGDYRYEQTFNLTEIGTKVFRSEDEAWARKLSDAESKVSSAQQSLRWHIEERDKLAAKIKEMADAAKE